MASQTKLSRDILKQFLPNHEAIRAFEQVLLNVDNTLPTTIEEVGNVASAVSAVAAALAAELQEVSDRLAEIAAAPAQVIGTIAAQNADSVDIDGGSIDGTVIGATSPASATVSLLNSVNSIQAGTTLNSLGAFGCNGQPPQPSVASGGNVATTGAVNTAPFGYTTAAQANDIITKLNTVMAALRANGILT